MERLVVDSGVSGLAFGLAVDASERTAGQADKCTGWMPRHEPAKKDVASCVKPRGAASER